MASVKFALSRLELPSQCLVLKPTVVKRLLKSTSPKSTMRQLGYRSLESLLKHESAAALLATAQLIESATWQRQLYRQASQLEVTDFELKPLTIVYEPARTLAKTSPNHGYSQKASRRGCTAQCQPSAITLWRSTTASSLVNDSGDDRNGYQPNRSG